MLVTLGIVDCQNVATRVLQFASYNSGKTNPITWRRCYAMPPPGIWSLWIRGRRDSGAEALHRATLGTQRRIPAGTQYREHPEGTWNEYFRDTETRNGKTNIYPNRSGQTTETTTLQTTPVSKEQKQKTTKTHGYS